MAQPYVGEIRRFAGNFAPAGWMFCNGQTLPISENETLFQLIGTTYGGDGQSTFRLPNLQSRVPVHQGSGGILAEQYGTESVTLTTNQIPAHAHPQLGSSQSSNQNSPAGNIMATTTVDIYVPGGPFVPFAANAVGPVGGSQPHNNVQPSLCINFIISLFGIFPNPT